MTTYLLDVNMILAMTDPTHVHHDAAHEWFARVGRQSWSTCPITENGYVRVASHPSYPNSPGNASVVAGILRNLCEIGGHEFWGDDVSLRQLVRPEAVLSHGQVTDVYLLGLAAHRRGKLATLDRRIPATLVAGGAGALEVIPA